nr:hypothetical protein [Tanacetum cinerariifolium]
MEPNIENITLNEYLMYKGRHMDLEKSYTSRKRVAPKRNKVLVYHDSDKEGEEYYWLPPLLRCFQTPQPCTIFDPIHHNSHKEVNIDSITLDEYDLYMAMQCSKKSDDSSFEEILDDLFKIGVENLRRMKHEVSNRSDDKTVRNTDHEDDNINENTAREEEEDEVKVEKQKEPDEEVANTPI